MRGSASHGFFTLTCFFTLRGYTNHIRDHDTNRQNQIHRVSRGGEGDGNLGRKKRHLKRKESDPVWKSAANYWLVVAAVPCCCRPEAAPRLSSTLCACPRTTTSTTRNHPGKHGQCPLDIDSNIAIAAAKRNGYRHLDIPFLLSSTLTKSLWPCQLSNTNHQHHQEPP